MASTIKLKNGSGAPLASALVQGEPAFDLTNKRLYTENASGTVIEVGTNPAAEITANGGIALPDNQKVTFGASDDLQIYHDGTNSYISDTGTGRLILKSSSDLLLRSATDENYINAYAEGSVDLFYDNSKKLSTTSTGIDVTGTVTADGGLIGDAVSGSLSQTGMLTVSDTNSANTWTNFTGTAAYLPFAHELAVVNLADATTNSFAGLYFMAGESSAASGISSARIGAVRTGASTADLAFSTRGGSDMNQAMRIAGSGDISFYEDTGTTAKFFWDASAESLGIGTTSPAAKLHSVTNGAEALRISHTTSGSFVSSKFVNDLAEGLNITNYGSTYSAGSVLSVGAGGVAINNTNDLAINVSTGKTIRFGIGNTERMRIDSSGNFLVGGTATTSAPALDKGVYLQSQTDGDVIGYSLFANDSINNRRSTFFLDDANAVYGFDTSYGFGGGVEFVIRQVGSEQLRVDSSGNLLVGKTTGNSIGTAGVEIDGGSDRIMVTRDGNVPLFLNRLTSDGTIAEFRKDGTTVGSISVTSSTTTYNITSDQRLKDNIVDAPSSSDDIDAIQVRSFDWKADGSHQKYGMIAQELEAVAPYAVTKGETEDDMWSVDYSKLVPMLIKEIQDLKAEVAALKGA